MKLVIQRVKEANVTVDGQCIGAINHGLVVFLGVGKNDSSTEVRKYADKLLKLRIFEDENGKTNRSIQDVSGELLIVSQFTLYADCKKGNRPNFLQAGDPEIANALYEEFIHICKEHVNHVATGEFGADMNVSLVNDGPFTIILDEQIL